MRDESTPYQCFFSYTRDDNDAFDGVVDRLRTETVGRFEATSGTPIEMFLDRESIGWGDDWRERIFDAINGSTLFIPVVTMRYFNSSMCREELSAFYEAAKRKNVSELVLPIVLAGKEGISQSSSDELVRIIAARSWIPIDTAWEAGYASSEWKTQVGRIVDGLQRSLQIASEQLSTSVALQVESQDLEPLASEVDEEVINEHMMALAQQIERIGPMMTGLAEVTTARVAGRDVQSLSPGQRTFLYGALAQDLIEPVNEFAHLTGSIESLVASLNAELRAYVAEIKEIDSIIARQKLAEFKTAASSLQEVGTFSNSAYELEQGLRLAALASTPLRNALRPMSTGVRSLRTVSDVIASWALLG